MSNLWTVAVEQSGHPYVTSWGEPIDEPVDHITHHELAGMYSADYDVPMTDVEEELRRDYSDWRHGMAEKPHGKDIQFGGPHNYIQHLKRDIAQNGMRSPLEVRGGNVVTDGNHRGVAAMELKMDRIPVRHIR